MTVLGTFYVSSHLPLKTRGDTQLNFVPFTLVFGNYSNDVGHMFTPRYSLLCTSDVRAHPSALRVCACTHTRLCHCSASCRCYSMATWCCASPGHSPEMVFLLATWLPISWLLGPLTCGILWSDLGHGLAPYHRLEPALLRARFTCRPGILMPGTWGHLQRTCCVSRKHAQGTHCLCLGSS